LRKIAVWPFLLIVGKYIISGCHLPRLRLQDARLYHVCVCLQQSQNWVRNRKRKRGLLEKFSIGNTERQVPNSSHILFFVEKTRTYIWIFSSHRLVNNSRSHDINQSCHEPSHLADYRDYRWFTFLTNKIVEILILVFIQISFSFFFEIIGYWIMNKQYKQIGEEVWKNRVEKIVSISIY